MDKLMLGDSGVCGRADANLNPIVVAQMAAALAVSLKQRQPSGRPERLRVLTGRDAHASSAWARDAAAAALAASGIEVLDLDVVTTAGAAMMVKHLNADAAMLARADDRPIPSNAIRLLGSDGLNMAQEHVSDILRLYESNAAAFVSPDQTLARSANSETHAVHVKRVLARLDVLGISCKRFKVALDTVNGAACIVAPTILSKLGCRLSHINATPDGRFPHDPEPRPENLAALCQEVRRQKADVGFALDATGQRLGIVDQQGACIGPEYPLAIAAFVTLAKKQGVLVCDEAAAGALDAVARACGGRVIRVAGGLGAVAHAMIESHAVIGGSGDGSVIDSRIGPAPDATVAMAYVLQAMAHASKTVSQIVEQIASTASH